MWQWLIEIPSLVLEAFLHELKCWTSWKFDVDARWKVTGSWRLAGFNIWMPQKTVPNFMAICADVFQIIEPTLPPLEPQHDYKNNTKQEWKSFNCNRCNIKTLFDPHASFPPCRTAWSTRSACMSSLTSRATRWRSRRMMCPPSGRMASVTEWAAWGCQEERECTQTHTQQNSCRWKQMDSAEVQALCFVTKDLQPGKQMCLFFIYKSSRGSVLKTLS